MKVIAGIDLAGSEKRDSGVCVIGGKGTTILILHSDEEIIELITKAKPGIVAVDAPLSLPKGRKSIDVRDGNHFRKCDLELRKLGIRFFPITLGPMRMLTKRGMNLKKKIAKISDRIKVIEVYPGASYDIFGVDRKNKNKIMKLLRKHMKIPRRSYTQDELDGACCALTGKLYLEKRAFGIGDKKEGQIIIPRKSDR